MEWMFICIVLIILGAVVWVNLFRHGTLKVGQSAPDFRLEDQYGRQHCLEDFRGNWLVLYFYPKDDTPGCTQQACAFRDDLDALKVLDAEVVGVSVDTVSSHEKFTSKFGLSFPLLADTTAEIASRYHSLFNLGMIKFARRNTFLIDPLGRFAKIYWSASAKRNSGEIVSDLKRLKNTVRSGT